MIVVNIIGQAYPILLNYTGEFALCLLVLQMMTNIALSPIPPTAKISFISFIKCALRAVKIQIFHSSRFIYSELP